MALRWSESCRFCGHSAGVVVQPSLRSIDVDCPHCGFLRVPDGFFQDLDSVYTAAVRLAVGEHLSGIGRMYNERLVLTKERFGEIVSTLKRRRA